MTYVDKSLFDYCGDCVASIDLYAYNTKVHPFPSTRYQGSKNKITNWIWSSVKDMKFETALDAFGGTGTIAHMLKRMGKEVTYNDILKFNYTIGKALIENNSETLSEKDVEGILSIPSNHPSFIEDNFPNIYFTDEENRWLDGIVSNINLVENEYKRSIALFALYQSCIIKRPYNLFHRANLYVRTSDVNRSFGNKVTWDKPFPNLFKNFVKECNSAVFDNGKACKSSKKNALYLEGEYDLVYIDTPYINEKGVASNYLDYYHFLEGMTDYENWNSRINMRYKNKPIKEDLCDSWTDKKTITHDFERLFSRFSDSSMVISYRDDGVPSIDELIEILSTYKDKVTFKKDSYQYVLSGKKTNEVLIIGI